MMKILSVLPNAPQYYGYVKRGNTYFRFTTDASGTSFEPIRMSFDSYEHFAGVMGKFNPWIYFLKDPIEAEELTLELLESLNLDCHSLE